MLFICDTHLSLSMLAGDTEDLDAFKSWRDPDSAASLLRLIVIRRTGLGANRGE
eukprot:CAMPEP_0174911458 /NCGR_PEP_ID=MMETSP0167-20121228/76727_1 /TAXON_ID=38298 /ORGANISM="Rhodella maculata, Strain CCMP736" /LENGTH=53 /DNA_ID=CAMNT_0016155957 /DNA_START=50 /DNA_END=208 /DNA_ORIENTATION=+